MPTITIQPTLVDPQANQYEPINIQYGSVQMQLPNLNDANNLPMSILLAALDVAARGWTEISQTDQLRIVGVFLQYLTHQYPALETELNKSADRIGDMGAILSAWVEQSGLDPKA